MGFARRRLASGEPYVQRGVAVEREMDSGPLTTPPFPTCSELIEGSLATLDGVIRSEVSLGMLEDLNLVWREH